MDVRFRVSGGHGTDRWTDGRGVKRNVASYGLPDNNYFFVTDVLTATTSAALTHTVF